MEADCPTPLWRNAGDVNMVGIRDKAGYRARPQQDDATTHELNTFIRTSVR